MEVDVVWDGDGLLAVSVSLHVTLTARCRFLLHLSHLDIDADLRPEVSYFCFLPHLLPFTFESFSVSDV